eukprot:TRINITY_DN13192_c0_g1_i1.p1 TRINITY_DN13192_c0_g1~~TRINITY_DN13192_c0_g1_i1.p1  ORF type:complete len:204 (-),score=12.95 TRINITY_DN13192_c0_g1_i1:177-746(-)
MAEPLLPYDILEVIAKFAADSPKSTIRLAAVCRTWHELLVEDNSAFWKDYAKSRWVYVDEAIPIQNWLEWIMARDQKIKQRPKTILDDLPHPIVNCLEWKFKCPLLLEDLEDFGDSKSRFCNSCKQNVYICENDEEVAMNVRAGHCVAYRPQEDCAAEWMGICEDPGDVDAVLAEMQRCIDAEPEDDDM